MSNFVVRSSELYHVGNENSGRYPRGSGERPYQHSNVPHSVRKKYKRYSKKELRNKLNNDVDNAHNQHQELISKMDSLETQFTGSRDRVDGKAQTVIANILKEGVDGKILKYYVRNMSRKELIASIEAHKNSNSILVNKVQAYVDGTNFAKQLSTSIPKNIHTATSDYAMKMYLNEWTKDADERFSKNSEIKTVASYVNNLSESERTNYWREVSRAENGDWITGTLYDDVTKYNRQ